MNTRLRIAASLLVIGSSAAQANLVVNGSFEHGIEPGLFINLLGGSTAITGWVVTGSKIDYVGSIWQASDGSRSLDLDGSTLPQANGGVAQTFATTPGVAYTVTFDMAGNPANTPTLKPMRVSAAGQSQDFMFDITGATFDHMGWLAKTWTFTAVAATTTLEFRSLTPPGQMGWGAALDNVSVSAVPEPGAWVLMLAGLTGFTGLTRRSGARRQAVAQGGRSDCAPMQR